jgi:hypothetical protein
MAERVAGRKRVRVGISASQEIQLKSKALATACSAAWVDAQFRSIEDRGADGTLIVVRIHDPGVYPPPGMVRCDGCGRYTPPNCVGSRGVCLDCAIAEEPEDQHVWGESPFHAMMEVIRTLKLRISEPRAR